MKKWSQLFCVFLLLWSILSGCSHRNAWKNPEASPRIVTQVDVRFQRGDTVQQRSYTHPEKMETILVYLRLLEPQGQPELDPERVIGDAYEITLRFTDGHRRIYRQRANRYLSADSHPWYLVNPEHAGVLYGILQDMPSDTL